MKLKVLKLYFLSILLGPFVVVSGQSLAEQVPVSTSCQQMQAAHCDCCEHEAACDQSCADHCLMMFSVSHFLLLLIEGWMPHSTIRVTPYFPPISNALPFPNLKGLLRPPKV